MMGWWAIMSMVFSQRLLEFKTQLCEECVNVPNYSFSPPPHDCVPLYESSIFFFATFSDGICTVFPAQKCKYNSKVWSYASPSVR